MTTWKVPSRARDEFEKACDASQKNQFTEAERHARGAIRKFQNYSAAWVMLGIILEEQNKSTDALDSCAHGAIIDAKYLPAYLCTAEISVRHHDWGHVLNSANLALRLKTTGDPYRYYYRAMAYLHMDDPEEAKKDALQAMDLDLNHEEPSFYLLMAEIYEREGDHPNALAQLRQFLKHPTDPHHERVARQLLANIESQQNIQ